MNILIRPITSLQVRKSISELFRRIKLLSATNAEQKLVSVKNMKLIINMAVALVVSIIIQNVMCHFINDILTA